jgi:hypothetical protein
VKRETYRPVVKFCKIDTAHLKAVQTCEWETDDSEEADNHLDESETESDEELEKEGRPNGKKKAPRRDSEFVIHDDIDIRSCALQDMISDKPIVTEMPTHCASSSRSSFTAINEGNSALDWNW